MADNQNYQVNLIMQVDQASAAKAQAAVDRLTGSVDKLAGQAVGAGKAQVGVGAQVANTYDEQAKAAGRLNTQLQNVAKTQQQVAQQGRTQIPVFAQFALFPAASLAQRLGAQSLSDLLFSASDVLGIVDNATIIKSNLTELARRLGLAAAPISDAAQAAAGVAPAATAASSGLLTLVGGLGVLLLAGVALGAVIGEVQRQFEEARKKARAYVDAQVEVDQLIARGGTREEVTAARDRAFLDNQGRVDVRNTIASILADFERTTGAIDPLDPTRTRQIAEAAAAASNALSAATGGQITDLGIAREEIKRLDDEIKRANAGIQAFNVALGDNATATNDAAAALEASGEKLVGRIQASADAYLESEQLRTSGTTEQVNERLAALDAERQALLLQDETLRTSAQATTKAVQEERRLIEERLVQNRLLQEQIELIRAEVAARERLEAQQELQRDLAKLQADFQEDSITAGNKYQFDLLDAEEDYRDKLLELDEDAKAKETELQKKHDDQREKNLDDHQRRLAEIERRFQIDFQNAVAERDALSAFLAQQKRDEDVRAENERYAALEKERDKDFKDQQKALKDNLEKQRRERKRDYDNRLRELRQQFDFEASERSRKFANERTQLQTAFNAEFSQKATHLGKMYSLTDAYHKAIENRALAALASITSYRGLASGASGGVNKNASLIPKFAGGGITPAYQDFLVGERGAEVLRLPMRGQVFTQAQYRQQAGGSYTFAPVFRGQTRTQMRREFAAWFDQFMDITGVPA